MQLAVSDDQAMRQAVIAKAITFPMKPVVERYAKDADVPIEVAREYEQELKRYLALCALDQTACYDMYGPVDKLWHTFLMFTQQYAAFCQSVAGRFLHHVPSTETDKRNGKNRERYRRFLETYREEFREEPPAHIWPRLWQNPPTDQQADCYTEGCGCQVGTCHPE